MRLLRSLRYNHVLALGLTYAGFVWPEAAVTTAGEWQIPDGARALPSPEQRAEHGQIARHWAPAFYQDTDDSYYAGDLITKFNFDGDYNGKNNWESMEGRSTVPAHVYYAVSETETHYFINYSVFHPRDWHEFNPLDRHENDLEGVSLAVEKNGSTGELVAMQTLAHRGFWLYSNRSDVSPGLESIDGPITFLDQSHPRLYLEAKGHGMYGCDEHCDSAVGGDGILYEAGDRADFPARADGNYTHRYSYTLIAMDSDGSGDGNEGLWHRRNDICDTCTFGAWGKLRGDNYGENRAATPWLWRERDQGPLRSGDMLCDPAFSFDARLDGPAFDAGFSHRYVAHAFRTHFRDDGDLANPPFALAQMLPAGRAVRLGGGPSEHSLCRAQPARPMNSEPQTVAERAR